MGLLFAGLEASTFPSTSVVRAMEMGMCVGCYDAELFYSCTYAMHRTLQTDYVHPIVGVMSTRMKVSREIVNRGNFSGHRQYLL